MKIASARGLTTGNQVRLVPASLPSPISGERRAAPPGTTLKHKLCLFQEANQMAVDKTS
jgi:hypothetical protein